MRIHVDTDLCSGHALCAAVAPEVYVLDDVGYCAADGHDVPDDLREAAHKGALACPERAITLSTD
ncbi:ferredoxin [Mycobacterium paraffinicum]|uniref:Ferredoxin n=1 Tax=Mycobacterium paraffinicum TaxID=53378 RepID=A0A1Q4I2B9_9MYCO|nr:ferredoxin [Mycobacterium paraffinicum]OJZ76020.1 ferredoxin [Mycobacterium paraffinicum]